MRNQKLYVQDIIKAIDHIESFVEEIEFEEFISDIKTQSAVIRQFEIIGEAVKKLDKSITADYPAVEWSAIAGMRDLLIHHYFGVDLDLVWETIHNDLITLKKVMIEIESKL